MIDETNNNTGDELTDDRLPNEEAVEELPDTETQSDAEEFGESAEIAPAQDEDEPDAGETDDVEGPDAEATDVELDDADVELDEADVELESADVELDEDDADEAESEAAQVQDAESEDVAIGDAETAADDAGWGFDTPDELKTSTAWDLPPDLIRERPERRRLIPLWVWGAIAAVLAGIGLTVGTVMFFMSSGAVAVPDVTGTALGVARSRLAQVGLNVTVEERRFSSAPVDQVLSQSPAAGEEVRRGSAVAVIVSAGTEEFTMPDVVGQGVALASSTLETRGLIVRIDPVPSDLPSDTVIASTPSPGSPVRTGDVVSLSVAAPNGTGETLRPYSLGGTVFVIDAAPMPEGATSDVTMEVTRRLRSLLEASGATVIMTRSGSATAGVDVVVRERIALEASATALVGLDVEASGAAGRIVRYPVAGQPVRVTASRQLASTVTSELARVAPPALMEQATSDPVFNKTIAPWLRVRLGSLAARPDTTSFADPRWADSIARSIYVGLGEQFALGSAAQ